MNELNSMACGFVGGFVAASMVIVSYYQYIISKTKQYSSAKNVLKDRMLLMGLEQEIVDIKSQLSILDEELSKKS